jgi:hypothetical protein
LRCISNLKVKLRHHAPNPTEEELKDYRSSVREYAKGVHVQGGASTKVALLPHRGCSRGASYATSGTRAGISSGSAQGGVTGPASGSALRGLAPPQKMNIITEAPQDDGSDVPPPPGPNTWSPRGFGLSGPPMPLAEVEESLVSNPPSPSSYPPSPVDAGVGGFGGDEGPVSPSETLSSGAAVVSGDGYAHGNESGGLRAVGAEVPQVAYGVA